jgi:hypothetical protein
VSATILSSDDGVGHVRSCSPFAANGWLLLLPD